MHGADYPTLEFAIIARRGECGASPHALPVVSPSPGTAVHSTATRLAEALAKVSGTDHRKRLAAIFAADAAGCSRLMSLDERAPPASRLEALKGDRNGQHSIRINDQWRLCFIWTAAGPERVEIVDYH